MKKPAVKALFLKFKEEIRWGILKLKRDFATMPAEQQSKQTDKAFRRKENCPTTPPDFWNSL